MITYLTEPHVLFRPALAVLVVLSFGIYSVLNRPSTKVITLMTKLDHRIPFWPAFSVPYLLFVPYLFLITIYGIRVSPRYVEIVVSALIIQLAAAAIYRFQQTYVPRPVVKGELRDPDKNYNKMSLDNLIALCPAIDCKAYLKYIDMENPGDINVGQKDYIAKLSGIWTDASADDLKTYLEWKLINSAAPYLSDDFVNANFEFNGKFMSGAQEIRSKDKRVIDVVNGSLGEALGELYVAKYFPPAAKQRILDLVANLKAALATQD